MSTTDYRMCTVRLGLASLDLDILVYIIGLLDVPDVISFRQTSRYFASVTRLRTVWHQLLVREILSRNLPIACPSGVTSTDIDSYTDSELERATLASIRREKQWQDATPTNSFSKQISSSRRFVLKFIGKPEGRYIMTFSLDINHTCLEVWDLDTVDEHGERVQSIGSFAQQGRLCGYAIDDGGGTQHRNGSDASSVKVAVAFRRLESLETSKPTTLHILDFNPSRSALGIASLGLALQVRKTLPCSTPTQAHAMRGRLLVLQVRKDARLHAPGWGALKAVDWTRSGKVNCVGGELGDGDSENGNEDDGDGKPGSSEISVQLLPWPNAEETPVLVVRFIHDWILVFREKSIEFYFLPPYVFRSLTRAKDMRTRTLAPVARHAWQWLINTLAVSVRESYALDCAQRTCGMCHGTGYVRPPCTELGEAKGGGIGSGTSESGGDGDSGGDEEEERWVCACRYRPLSLVARFDSYYPWPVNLLHHFVLLIKQPSSLSVSFITFSSFPPTTSLPATTTSTPTTSANNTAPNIPFPWKLPPTLLHTLPSTVEMLNPSRLALDRHGMLLWTDNEPCLIPVLVPVRSSFFPSNEAQRNLQGSELELGAGVGVQRRQQEARQRVAGQRLSLPSSHSLEPSDYTLAGAENVSPEDPADAIVAANELAASGSGLGQLGASTTPTPPESSSTSSYSSYSSYSTQSWTRARVYVSSPEDAWCAVEFCAARGRVVVGSAVGKMEVWDYFG